MTRGRPLEWTEADVRRLVQFDGVRTHRDDRTAAAEWTKAHPDETLSRQRVTALRATYDIPRHSRPRGYRDFYRPFPRVEVDSSAETGDPIPNPAIESLFADEAAAVSAARAWGWGCVLRYVPRVDHGALWFELVEVRRV